jgi:hypothetical protein
MGTDAIVRQAEICREVSVLFAEFASLLQRQGMKTSTAGVRLNQRALPAGTRKRTYLATFNRALKEGAKPDEAWHEGRLCCMSLAAYAKYARKPRKMAERLPIQVAPQPAMKNSVAELLGLRVAS